MATAIKTSYEIRMKMEKRSDRLNKTLKMIKFILFFVFCVFFFIIVELAKSIFLQILRLGINIKLLSKVSSK